MCVSISLPLRLLAKCGAELSADFVLPSHVPFSHCLTSPQILSSKTVQIRTESTAETPASEMAALLAHPPDGKASHPLSSQLASKHPGGLTLIHAQSALPRYTEPEVLTEQCFPISPVTAQNRLKVCTKVLTEKCKRR